uniref:Uncharacterized protein n=1 Tax=Ananas comosus var. bracteatus TaxID=296719 RepID=A0A6V7PYD7_ANACO|nr:unnamed protein product [Ananas comosus var. bracteatus]
MGAVLWPALSESTKAASKPSPSASSSSSSSSSDFLKGSDGSASASPGPMIAASSPKANLNNPNPKSNPNHAASQREKSMKHGTLANGWPSQPLIINPDKQPSPDPSPKDQPNINHNNWSMALGVWQQQWRWWGSHHGGYNGRRDHGRGAGGGFDGYYRNANVRDVHVAQQPRSIRPPPPFVRSPLHVPPPPPFISPPSLARPFGHPMAFPEMHSPVYYVPAPPPPEAIGGLAFVAHPAATLLFFRRWIHRRQSYLRR